MCVSASRRQILFSSPYHLAHVSKADWPITWREVKGRIPNLQRVTCNTPVKWRSWHILWNTGNRSFRTAKREQLYGDNFNLLPFLRKGTYPRVHNNRFIIATVGVHGQRIATCYEHKSSRSRNKYCLRERERIFATRHKIWAHFCH